LETTLSVISRIIGTGSFVPKKFVTNHDLELMVETSEEWITTRTGIRERRICVNESTSEIASKAGRAALEAAGVSPQEIDLVIVATVTPDMSFPSTACFVQSELGIKAGAAAFDVSAACSGFLFALDCADRYVKSGGFSKALVIGVDVFSRLIDWTDRATCVLFGDGAGAVVLSAETGARGILSSHVHSDGSHWNMLYARGHVETNPFEKEEPKEAHLVMQGNDTFKFAVRTMGAAITETLEASGLKTEDIALLIPHQANIRIINAMRERLKLEDDRVFTNIEKYGNTSAGSIPLAFDEAVREGRLKENDIVLFVAFGGGLTWASSAIRW